MRCRANGLAILRRKLLLIELNEVPYRVIDAYCRARPQSTLARILPRCARYNTTTEDKQVLDPWVSWPTFHRGVNDEMHQILHLGQVDEEVDGKFPPIWRMLKERGLSVGVFGSLHSSSIPADVARYSFYVPDYFDDKVFAHPARLRAFQELNLLMTRQSARNVSRKVPLATVGQFLLTAPALGITLPTVADSAAHLIRETFNPSLRIRRRAYQPLLMADLFLRQLERSNPDFATFYTNHVAAAMHRYWGAAFPEDYARPLDGGWIEQYRGEITFAMDKFDRVLERVVKYANAHPEYTVMIASSMGQAAIPAQQTFEFLTITDLTRFMSGLGVPPGVWEAKPAMVPCQNVLVQESHRNALTAAIDTLTIDGVRIRRDPRPIGPMSYDERERGFFQFFIQFDSYRGGNQASVNGIPSQLSDVGLGLMAHEDGVNCTAQHVPEGSLLIYDPLAHAAGPVQSEPISTLDVVPSVMKFFGFQKESYMRGSPSVALR
jgi:hypothetical protein